MYTQIREYHFDKIIMHLFLDTQNERNEKFNNISNEYFNNLHEQVKL